MGSTETDAKVNAYELGIEEGLQIAARIVCEYCRNQLHYGPATKRPGRIKSTLASRIHEVNATGERVRCQADEILEKRAKVNRHRAKYRS